VNLLNERMMTGKTHQEPLRFRFFPLQIVVFPGEEVRLHVFEPRYRQLIAEVLESGDTFCIPPVIDKEVSDTGTEIRLSRMAHRYEDGRMDIIVQGVAALEVLDFYPEVIGKLYPGGPVRRKENIPDGEEATWGAILELVTELWELMQVDKPIPTREVYPDCFALGHLVSLSLKQEYEMLAMARESARQQFLLRHLQESLPLIRSVAEMQRRARMNGQFREFPPLAW